MTAPPILSDIHDYCIAAHADYFWAWLYWEMWQRRKLQRFD